MRLAKTETLLLAACLLLLALAAFGPAVAQPPHAHDFADARTLWGIPHCLDVLSNLPFALAGALGLVVLVRVPAAALAPAQRACARLFFIGLVATSFGSSWYHLAPDDMGLLVDRTAMAIAFAGLLGLLATGRVSERAGATLAAAVLLFGPVAVLVWFLSGNVLPWAVVQFGGIALILLLLALRRVGDALPVRWSLVLLAYAVAKLFEINDHRLFEASGQLLSGHTLKHLVAACAAWPVIAALTARSQQQNGRQPAAHAA
jgi:hypothetical protein